MPKPSAVNFACCKTSGTCAEEQAPPRARVFTDTVDLWLLRLGRKGECKEHSV